MTPDALDRRVPRRLWAHLAIGLVAVAGLIDSLWAGRGWWRADLPEELSRRMTWYFIASLAYLAVAAISELMLAWRLARYRGPALLAPRLWPWSPLVAVIGPLWVLLRGPESRLMLAGFAEQPIWIALVALAAWVLRFWSQRVDHVAELPPAIRRLIPAAARPWVGCELLAAAAVLLAIGSLELLPVEDFFPVRPPRS